MVKVPSDPAQVVVNHASFRVQLGATSARALQRTARVPLIPSSVRPARRTPVVWSGRGAPDDQAATQLLRAVMRQEEDELSGPGAATQVLPRIGQDTQPLPTVAQPRRPMPPDGPFGGVRTVPRPGGRAAAAGAPHGHPAGPRYDGDAGAGRPYGRQEGYDQDGYHGQGPDGDRLGHDGDGRQAARRGRGRGEPVRHAWYPGRRMNLGIVLLPLRVFLGFVTIYAGMSKLCDPVYFDGGKRGSMVAWLSSLHPWTVAGPLRDFAVAHPVGSGLGLAFLQVVAGVLTVLGLWQRVAAAVGALLSAALLVTVSWRTVAVYDTPDIVYLAAWSPLVIAGAPVYSADGRLAGEAWRRLGPRGASVWDLRRRVLRRGTLLATVVVGLTLVVGSMLGEAVRSTAARTSLPGQSRLPVNDQQGLPLPQATGDAGPGAGRSLRARGTTSPSASKASPSPSASSSSPPVGGGRPGAARPGGAGGGGQVSPRQPAAPQQHSSRPGGAGSGSGVPQPSVSSGGGSESGGALGGLLGSGPPSGWLLGASRTGGTPGAA